MRIVKIAGYELHAANRQNYKIFNELNQELLATFESNVSTYGSDVWNSKNPRLQAIIIGMLHDDPESIEKSLGMT